MTGRVEERPGAQLSSNYRGTDCFVRVLPRMRPNDQNSGLTGRTIMDLFEVIIRSAVKLLHSII
jgi:hypothetical protein